MKAISPLSQPFKLAKIANFKKRSAIAWETAMVKGYREGERCAVTVDSDTVHITWQEPREIDEDVPHKALRYLGSMRPWALDCTFDQHCRLWVNDIKSNLSFTERNKEFRIALAGANATYPGELYYDEPIKVKSVPEIYFAQSWLITRKCEEAHFRHSRAKYGASHTWFCLPDFKYGQFKVVDWKALHLNGKYGSDMILVCAAKNDYFDVPIYPGFIDKSPIRTQCLTMLHGGATNADIWLVVAYRELDAAGIPTFPAAIDLECREE
jgi:hypothetical protein